MRKKNSQYKIMVFGVGAFSQGILRVLKEAGADVSTYLTGNYAHYGPMLEGKTFHKQYYPNPCKMLKDEQIDFIIPMSIDWALQDWTEEFLRLHIPILCPTGEAYQIERERDFSQRVCERFNVPFAKSYVVSNKLEAVKLLEQHPMPYVIKNTLCSPTSPIHTIVSETIEQTRFWLEHIDYKEGALLQEYKGRKEVGHIVFVSNGEVHSLVTNQEYKHAFDGNQGIVAGAPLGGLVEWDPQDKYGIAKALMHPLLPWFKESKFHGPLQVTAIWDDHQWQVLEFNIRLGVTSSPLILRMLHDPIQTLERVARNQAVTPTIKDDRPFGASLTLAGYGYPYTQIVPPRLPIEVTGEFDCDVWWNEVDADLKGQLFTSGHRLADLTATGRSIDEALEIVYRNIQKISCAGSYYRTDIGKSLWPPVYN
jgi:phosphoribosylamine-glycine ligase